MVEIITAIISISALVISGLSILISISNYRYQLYLNFLEHYRTEEMMDSIKAIWDFARKTLGVNKVKEISKLLENNGNKELLKKKYLEEDNEKKIVKDGKDTLTYKRRVLSQYYLYLTSAYMRTFPWPNKNCFFDWISPSDLAIFDILIPLDEAEAKRCGIEEEETKIKLRNFKKFKAACIEYYNNIDC
ncbi:MAG: hypothetical protein MUO82_11695 [Candidatus Thermoplasmatota archaeon]|nr:hypothetical protein [Candidatus Thermoplasmatota archaeon]